MKKVIYLQPNAKDPVLQDKIVLNIVKKYDQNVDTVDFVDETGGEARTYSVNNRIILKVQRPHRLRDKTSLEREVFFLKELEKYPEISVPIIYGYGRQGEIEYTCMSKVQGKAVRYLELSQDKRAEILFDLGKTLHKIHSIDNQIFFDSKLFPIDKLEDMKSRLEFEFNWKLNRLDDIPDSEAIFAKELASKLLKTVTKVDKYVALHSNPASSHTFASADLKFSGLIDFGDAYISHPVLDLKRWNISDRKYVVKGYFSESIPSENFQQTLNVANSVDNIIEILKKQKAISFIKDFKELI